MQQAMNRYIHTSSTYLVIIQAAKDNFRFAIWRCGQVKIKFLYVALRNPITRRCKTTDATE